MLIELRIFRPGEGVSDAQLREADDAVCQRDQVFRTGFVRRTTARAEDGRWMVETLWGGAEFLDAALASPSAETDALDALIDAESLVVERFETLD